jgi:hypothetical protein
MRQKEVLSADVEVPSLVILLGVLMLFARMPSIPVPEWMHPDKPPAR